MSPEDLIETFLRQTYTSRGCSEKTIRARRSALNQLREHLGETPIEDARTDDLTEYLAANPDWAANTRATKAAAIRVFCRWLQITQRRVDNPSILMGHTPARKGVPRPTPIRRYKEARAAAAASGNVRDILLLELPAKLGLRRAEACAVHTDHVEEGWLRVQGKGGRERIVPIPPDVQELLDQLPVGWVFPSKKGGHIRPNRYGARVSELLGDGWSTHSLRHRFGTNVMAASHDLRVTADLMGHASTNTTSGYTAVASRDKRVAVEGAEQMLKDQPPPAPKRRHRRAAGPADEAG